MANKIIQLKDGNDNVYPKVAMSVDDVQSYHVVTMIFRDNYQVFFVYEEGTNKLSHIDFYDENSQMIKSLYI